MKAIILLALAVFGAALLTGCQHEHWEHRNDSYDRPAPDYERRTSEYGNHDSDRDWDRR